jgi:hypothetical protein
MSFIDNAMEVLDRTEASLQALIADALKAKAYREIVAIAALAESLAAIGTNRSRDGKRAGVAEVGAGSAAGVGSETTKDTTPSWMWPKTT